MTQTGEFSEAKLRALIADDNQETRRNVRLMLALNPEVLVVAIAKDGQEAVELSRQYLPDLVILDINMSEMNGLKAFEEIRQAQPDTACIIISAEQPTRLPDDSIGPGMIEFLIKPFMVEELNETVHRVATSLREARRRRAEEEQLNKENDAYFLQMAEEYAKARRTDKKAVDVFEKLANNPDCELRWLRILAILYVFRQEWPKLETLASRLALKSVNDNK